MTGRTVINLNLELIHGPDRRSSAGVNQNQSITHHFALMRETSVSVKALFTMAQSIQREENRICPRISLICQTTTLH